MADVSRETFTCAVCGGTFGKVRPDEEALADMHRIWGDVPQEQAAIVCNPCHRAVETWLATLTRH